MTVRFPDPTVATYPDKHQLDQLWQLVFRARLATIVLLSITAAAIPSVGPNRFWLAMAVLVYGIVYNVGLLAVLRHQSQLPTLLPYTDTATCLLFPLLVAAAYVPATLMMLATIALATTASPRRHAVGAVVFSCIGLAAVTWIVDPPSGSIVLLSFAIASSLTVICVGGVAADERRLRLRLRTLVDGLDAVVWESAAPLDRYRYVSSRCEQLLGFPPSKWLEPAFWFAHLHPDDRDRVAAERLLSITGSTGHATQYRMIHASGQVVHLHEKVSFTRDHNGRVLGAQGVMVDVSERMGDQEQILQYADLVERIQIGLIVLRLDRDADDLSLRLEAANPAASDAAQHALSLCIGHPFDRVFPMLLDTSLPQRLADVVRSGEPFEIAQFEIRNTDGSPTVFHLRAFPLAGRAVGISLEDVTGRSLAADALRRQALHDGLTGLPNRALLKERLSTALRSARETSGSVALLVMDLDQFKEVNDALGHHHGDLLLMGLADRLRERFGDVELISRLGGDEFAMLLAATTLTEAEATARAIGEALHEPFHINQLRIQTSASIGIAVFPEHAGDAESLAQRADVAMYQAKRGGGGYAVYAAEHDRSSVRRLTLLSDFRRALEQDELVLHYQPVMSIPSGRVMRVEALVRWEHPTYGLMPPADFIELAELSGFIQPLTRWVLDRSVARLARWHAEGHTMGLAVNLSVRNLYDPTLPEHLEELLVSNGLKPHDLTLEVTESELMDDPNLALQVLTRIDSLGIATSIDDFGTGYSSLTYLKDLPVREIKIDRSFVMGMCIRADDLTIVRSTIDLGHNLGLEVVAEGVEDEATLSRLASLGCDLAQGYHVGRPMAPDDLRRWMLRRLPGRQVPLTD